jgi:hypothetical protein
MEYSVGVDIEVLITKTSKSKRVLPMRPGLRDVLEQ